MRYKVEFENNIPVRAHPMPAADRLDNVTQFGELNGKATIQHLCVEAENESDALRQAKRIIETIFRF